MSFENYRKTYSEYLNDVAKETVEKYPEETKMLFEFIDNWIDLFPKDDERFTQTLNSLSGIILMNSWKLTNWISYEILNGEYFEAIRNLRFIFEGCVFAVIIEDVIESEVFRKWKTLGNLSLKIEIFKLWEECKRKRVYSKKKIDHEKIGKIVSDFVNKNIEDPKKDLAAEYIEVYSSILSNEKLYLSTSKMVKECAPFLKIDENDTDELRKLWHELSGYQHFSHKYLEALSEDPDFCFVEKTNDKLFKSSMTFYFQTLDFLYAVLAWRLLPLRKEIIEMCKWWKDNFNKTFRLTEMVLQEDV